MLDIIERLVIKIGYVYLRLDGSTKQQDRQGKVDQFNTSPSIFLFLISTTAGGLGLNLTAANRYNPPFFLMSSCMLHSSHSWYEGVLCSAGSHAGLSLHC